MTAIEVTAGTLSLHSCAACGRHLWERDGRPVERAEVLASVQRLPASRPTPRPAPVPAAQRRNQELRDMLGSFTVLGEHT